MSDVIFNNTGDIGFHNSADILFTRNIPTLSTQAVSAIENDELVGNGTITDLGGENSTERGFCFIQAATGDPTVADDYVSTEGDFSVGAFDQLINLLTSGKNYRVRPFARNSTGIGYGTTVGAITDLSLSDAIALSDIITRGVGLELSDGVELSDAVVKAPSSNQADEIDLSDAISKAPQVNLADEATLADSIVERNFEIVKADTVELTDVIVKKGYKNLDDAIDFSDQEHREAAVSLNDGVGLTDSVTNKNIQLVKTDTLNLTDAVVKNFGTSLQDAISLTDSRIKRMFVAKADSIDLSDAITSKNILVALQDLIGLSDIASKSFGRSFQDNLSLSDSIIKEPKITKSDGLEFADLIIGRNFEVVKSDIIELFEVIAKGFYKEPLHDALSLSDQVNKNTTVIRQDTISLVDSYVKDIIFHIETILSIRDHFRIVETDPAGKIWRDMIVVAAKIRQLVVESRTREVVSTSKIREVVCTPINRQSEETMLVFSPKQNYEEYYAVFNFARVVTPSTSILTASVVVYDAAGTPVTATLTDETKLTIVGLKVYVWVRGGSEQTYKITCKIEMSNGEKFEQDAELEVTEI